MLVDDPAPFQLFAIASEKGTEKGKRKRDILKYFSRLTWKKKKAHS